MARVVLSGAARRDRRDITTYTRMRFGDRAPRHLRGRLEAALLALGENPLLGRTNGELDPPDACFRYWVVSRTFVVVYEATVDGVRVARIVHGARNIAAELARDSGRSDNG